MKLLIAALALLSFVATSTLPETVVAQAAAGQTQAAPDQTNTGAPKATKKTTHRKHVASKKGIKHSATLDWHEPGTCFSFSLFSLPGSARRKGCCRSSWCCRRTAPHVTTNMTATYRT